MEVHVKKRDTQREEQRDKAIVSERDREKMKAEKSLMQMHPRSQIDWSYRRLLLFLEGVNCYS